MNCCDDPLFDAKDESDASYSHGSMTFSALDYIVETV